MTEKLENRDIIVKNWLDSAEKNIETMQHLLKSKDYSWSLFIGHLVIEKTLKALYVKKMGTHAIFSHDLLRLAHKIDLPLNKEQEEWLDEITTFNINARYDNYKQEFYRLCTREFTMHWIKKIEEIREWLMNQF
jgi:HEPN domain-containing protein